MDDSLESILAMGLTPADRSDGSDFPNIQGKHNFTTPSKKMTPSYLTATLSGERLLPSLYLIKSAAMSQYTLPKRLQWSQPVMLME